MNTSLYFSELFKIYQTELDDLSSDCDNKNILKVRLLEKRNEFNQLIPLINQYPELVAVIFHNQVTIIDKEAVNHLITLQPNEFPDWTTCLSAVEFSSDTLFMVDQLLKEKTGVKFLISVICLEFMLFKMLDEQELLDANGKDAKSEDVNREDMNDEDAQASAENWLEQQGFDRLE
jgi:hypothetical protein